jgi:hypothetical protein
MGTQSGVLRIKGKVGELSFFRSRDGYNVRKSEGIEGKRIKTDPGYQRTREHMAEFGRACQSARLLRTALRSHIDLNNKRSASSRLVRLMLTILHTDATHGRGERTVAAGDLSLLTNFRFYEDRSFASVIIPEPTVVLDRAAGAFTVTIPSLTRGDVLVRKGATHFRITAMTVEADFDKQKYVLSKAEGDLISMADPRAAEASLVASFTPNSSLPVIGAIGIQFVDMFQNEEYALTTGDLTTLDIVEVSTV